MIRYILLFLLASASALADLHFSHPLVPPKVDDIVGFANGPSFDFRISRQNFLAHFRHARSYTVLPADLEKRGEAGDLGYLADVQDAKGEGKRGEILYDLHGVFTDKQGTVFFWQALGPRLLIVVTEDRYGCYYYLDDKEPAEFELQPIR